MTTEIQAPISGRAPGNVARARVVLEAAQLASAIGLEGLTIGRLAAHLDMPKSSLYTLFGSKEALQIATVESAKRTFAEVVVLPAFAGGRSGVDLLNALCENYLEHIRRRVFPGGCFFVAGAVEFGSRQGDVRDLLAQSQGEWQRVIRKAVRQAAAAEQLPSGADVDQLTFEICGLLTSSAIYAVLHADDTYCARAQAAISALVSTN